MLASLILTLAQAAAPSGAASSEAYRFDTFRIREKLEIDGSSFRTLEVGVLLRTPAAVAQFGQLAVGYVKDYADVQFKQVRVQKPDGSSRAVADAVLEDLNPLGINDRSMPIDVRIKKLTIPRLEPGDRLSYTVETAQKPFVEGDASGEIKFLPLSMDGAQSYELDIPAESRFRVNLRPGLGVSWETLPSEKERLVRRLSVSVPQEVIGRQGRTEAQVVALQTPDVSYTTFSSWQEVGAWWWRMSEKQLSADDSVKSEAARLTAGKRTPREKVEALAAFVATQVRYLNVGFGVGRMQPRTPGSVLSSRFGDCKDKVGLLMALAKATGLDLRPVLINSARLDLSDTSPGPNQFDHVIAVAKLGPTERDWVWFDATNSLSPVTTLSPATRDKRALLIEPTGAGTIVRTPAQPEGSRVSRTEMTASLDPSGVLKGKIRLSDRTDSEPALRMSFGSAPREQYVEVVRSLLRVNSWKEARLSDVRTGDPSDIAEPFWLEFTFEKDVADIDSEKDWKLWVPDWGNALPELGEDTTTRKPATFTGSEVSFKATIEIPEGVTARAPLSISLDRPFANVTSNYSVSGRTLKLERTLRFPNAFLTPDQVPAYNALKRSTDTDREQDFVLGPVKIAGAGAAAALQKQGKAAWNQKDFPKALALLEKAAEADPKLKDIYVDIGLAHREIENYDKAVTAFTLAIAADAYSETAYAERAYAYFELRRPEDAEKDLLKQIEVAPFKDWSYRRLATYRKSQRRFKEAAELFAKSLAIDASPVADWIELGWCHAQAGNAAEARAAFVKADQLGITTGRRTHMARGYVLIGDLKTADALARKDLPELTKKASEITKDDFASQMYWTDRMVEAWEVIGSAAFAGNDLDTGERFLKAAWEGGLSPDSGFAYTRLLARRGKTSDASAVLAAVTAMRPSTFQRPEMPALLKSLGSDAVKATASTETRRLRAIPIALSNPPARLSQSVTVLVQDGRITAAKGFSKEKETELAPVLEALIGKPAPWFDPDGKAVAIVRDGYVNCGTVDCTWFARIEAAPRPPEANGSAIDVGSIAVAQLAPPAETPLVAGSTIVMKVSLDYTLQGTKEGQVALYAVDDRTTQLLKPQLRKAVKPGKGVVEFVFDIVVPKEANEVHLHALVAVGIAPTKTTTTVIFKVQK